MRIAGRCGLGLKRLGLALAPSVSLGAPTPGATRAFLSAAPLCSASLRAPLRLAAREGRAPRCLPAWAQGAARWASGTVKMWNDEKGFGFITPEGGGEDVFVHRSALGEDVSISAGQAVTYDAEWDDRKKKDRAQNVKPAQGGGGGGGRDADSGAAQRSSAPGDGSLSSGGGGGGQARSYNLVGSFAEWAVAKEPMATAGDDAPDGGENHVLRQRITVRSSAPKAESDNRREEFQILAEGNWDKRLYPAGGDGETVVVVKPGAAPVRVAGPERNKGHGRNWAVEGKPGMTFDVLFDPTSRTVAVEMAFKES